MRQVTDFIKSVPNMIPVSDGFKKTALLQGFGLFKIPLIFFCSPKVLILDEEVCQIKIPLNRRTRNHWNTMYFGALAIGADCACGLLAFNRIIKDKLPVSLLFKDVQAEFYKRADGDVIFTCRDGQLILDMVSEALKSGERVSRTTEVLATVPQTSGDEPVARFKLTLSLKKK